MTQGTKKISPSPPPRSKNPNYPKVKGAFFFFFLGTPNMCGSRVTLVRSRTNCRPPVRSVVSRFLLSPATEFQKFRISLPLLLRQKKEKPMCVRMCLSISVFSAEKDPPPPSSLFCLYLFRTKSTILPLLQRVQRAAPPFTSAPSSAPVVCLML